MRKTILSWWCVSSWYSVHKAAIKPVGGPQAIKLAQARTDSKRAVPHAAPQRKALRTNHKPPSLLGTLGALYGRLWNLYPSVRVALICSPIRITADRTWLSLAAAAWSRFHPFIIGCRRNQSQLAEEEELPPFKLTYFQYNVFITGQSHHRGGTSRVGRDSDQLDAPTTKELLLVCGVICAWIRRHGLLCG